MPRLENWSLVIKTVNPYQAPELGVQCLHGFVYGYPRFEDGTEITTSRIERIEEEIVVTKSGTRYALGDVDPDYEKLYPNARERLFKGRIM